MPAYYNEIEPYAAQWLRNLIAKGHIAPGDVDERDIRDVRPDDLRGYTQCHFFAGIGVWSAALRAAGWPDDRPVWTGSCPCQPFSAAGKGDGFDDERHLWPFWHYLIEQCGPPNLFGEQVASKDGLGWLDLVQADMEGTGYACWPLDLCAAGVGAPHIRQRLWFTGVVADTARIHQRAGLRDSGSTGIRWHQPSESRAIVELGHHYHSGSQGHAGHGDGGRGWADALGPVASPSLFGGVADRASGGRGEERSIAGGLPLGDRTEGFAAGSGDGGSSERMGDAELLRRYAGITGDERGQEGSRSQSGDVAAGSGGDGALEYANRGSIPQPLGNADQRDGQRPDRADAHGSTRRPGPVNGVWGDADWLFCRDGKWRPVEPGTFPLAHGAASRVGRLRAYGNAIVLQAAQAVIEVYLEAERDGGLAAVDNGGGVSVDSMFG